MSGGTDPMPASARRPDLVGDFLRSPLRARTWRAFLAILLGFGVATLGISALTACFSAGGPLLIWLVGIPIIGLGIEVARVVARVERWRMTFVDGRPLTAHPYRPIDVAPRRPYGTWVRAWAEAEFLDANRWRDVVYVLVLVPLAAIECTVAVTLWLLSLSLIATPLFLLVRGRDLHVAFVDLRLDSPGVIVVGAVAVLVGFVLVPVAASVSAGLMALHRPVVEGILCVDPTAALRQDVERLRGSRSAALELEASELRRLERDIHDGAQQRLVMLSIDLGLAEERLDSDPAAGRQLVRDAREQARLALSELRDLVRGAAPSILTDRGLVPALAAVAGGCPVPTTLDSTVPAEQRLPAAVERAAYFVVAESLANVAKHSRASTCHVAVRLDAGHLVVEVRDDGEGGATVAPGGGLAGLRDRVQALDGTLSLSSPPGGPTVVHVDLPIAPDATQG